MISNLVIPSENVLIENYESLSETKKQFVDYLVEKRNYPVNQAILIAQNIPDGIKIRKMEPRLEAILDHESFYCDSLIDLKRMIRIYRDLPESEKVLIYVDVVHNHEKFNDALKRVKDYDLALTGYFETMEAFGKHLVFEEDVFYDHYLLDVFEFFVKSKVKFSYCHQIDSFDLYDLIDYEKVAERYVYGWHGGAGIAPYSRYDDPERPDKWLFVHYF